MGHRLASSRELFVRITALFVMLLMVSLGFGVTFSGLKDVWAVSPPNVISYQGRILNSNGVPVSDASVSMKFELYTAVSGGTCLWSNSSANCNGDTPASTTARSVTLSTGLFTARLGDTSDSWAAIGDSIFADNASVFLQVTIAGEALSPRKPLDAVPYALNAETLDGLSSADFDLDRAYENDSDKILSVDAADLEFSLDGSGFDFIIDMQSDGDFVLQDSGVAFFTVNDSRQIAHTFDGTTGNAVTLTGNALTTGNLLTLIGGNFTDDGGVALKIDVTETTATADLFVIETDVGSSNNTVFRIEADGRVISDIGFTAGASTTSFLDGEIQTSGNLLLDIDGGNLVFDQATIIGDGSALLTINSDETLFLDVANLTGTGTLTIQSGGGGPLALNASSGRVVVSSGNDFSIGADALEAPFSIDSSENIMRLGSGAGTDAVFNMYSSTGGTGAITYSNDQWEFSGGNLSFTGNPTYTSSPGQAAMTQFTGTVSVGAAGGAGIYSVLGQQVTASNSAAEGGGGQQHDVIAYYGTAQNTGTGQVQNLTGGFFIGSNQSSDASAVGLSVTGVRGRGSSNSAVTVPTVYGLLGEVLPGSGTITTARAVYGQIMSGSGDVTTGLGGDFINTAEGTTRYGVRGSALGGTNNYAGYFYAAATHIESSSTPSTPGLATGAGDLYVWDAVEIDGTGSTTTQVLNVSGNTTNFLATFFNDGNADNRQGIVIQGCLDANPTSACNLIEFRDGNGDVLGAIEGDGAGGVTNASSGSDYAELFDGTYADFGHGDVIALNPSGQVEVATDPSRVIGVLSVNPNTLGNWVSGWETTGSYVPVALLGQVPVTVNTEGGSISVGDHVTLSSVAGVAKKATGIGYTIGRALESHTSGTDTIQIFIQPGWHGVDVITDDGGDVAISSAINLLGNLDSTIEMTMFTDVTDSSDYKLSIQNDDDDEIAFVNNNGDLAIAGRLYPSDRGTLQTDKYIYYDGSSGAGGDFMRTNASGWGSGSYDFAEMFPSAQALSSGEVVIFASDDEHVMRSNGTTYDRRIAGIVSTQPGFLAGDNKQGHVPIALAGRVPTHVSGENGAIAVGDPLTTSSKDGYAMKATEAGPIVGYAMEPFSGTTGSIIAFVRPSYYDGGPVDASALEDNVLSHLANTSTLNLSGTINLNTGSIINVAAVMGMGQLWAIEADGTIKTRGQIIQLVKSHQNELVETYATFSRLQTIELSGTVQMTDGAAAVRFEQVDPLFNDIIASDVPYRVFLTADQPTGALYAVHRDIEGFSIRESLLGNIGTNATIDWMVIAYHKDFAPVEVEDIIAADQEAEQDGSGDDVIVQEEPVQEVAPPVEEPQELTEEVVQGIVQEEQVTEPESVSEQEDLPEEDVIE